VVYYTVSINNTVNTPERFTDLNGNDKFGKCLLKIELCFDYQIY